MISRRMLMTWGLVGTGLLALGGVGLGMRSTVMIDTPSALKALGPREYAILAAMADRICLQEGDLPSASELGVAEKVDATLHALGPEAVSDMKLALRFVENALAGLIFDGRFTTFTGSSPVVQDAILDNLQNSSVAARRTIYVAISGLCKAAFWSDPAAFPHTGYPGPPDFGMR